MLYAFTTGTPSAVLSVVMSNLPTARVVRYVACGLLERQLKRVQPSFDDCDWSTPLEIACVPSGTATDTSYVALSRGWSFDGNHQAADSGSFAPIPPSGVRCQEVKPYSFTSDGLPA